MKTIKAVVRHFPYKHPLFGTKNKPLTGEKSVYYYWWAFLRQNKAYLNCCEMGGAGPLAVLYADFEDVRGGDFKAWWTEGGRGARLFAEPPSAKVEVLTSGALVPSQEDFLNLSLPKNLPKRYLIKRVAELLTKKENHSGARGVQNARKSNALYKVKAKPDLGALSLTLKIYDFRKENPKLKLWEIGNRVPRFMLGSKIRATDTPAEVVNKQSVLASAVSRHLRKAGKIIESSTTRCLSYSRG